MVYMLYRWNRLVSSRRRFPAVAGSLVAAGLSVVSGTVPSTGIERESFFIAVLSVLCLVPGGKMVICLYLRSRLSGISNRNGCTQCPLFIHSTILSIHMADEAIVGCRPSFWRSKVSL